MSRAPLEATRTAATYREAARRIAERREEYSCFAVAAADSGTRERIYENKAVKRYLAICDQSNLQSAIYLACGEARGTRLDTEDRWCRRFRVLLLCFTAAMVEAGDA